MSIVYQVGSTWPGFSALRYLVIFGDSYSAVGYDHRGDHPSASHPLGILFPGETYNEPDLPNWVGYLIVKYCPPPRFNPSEEEQDGHYIESPLLVYNYARGGDTVAGVRSQIESFFIPSLVKERSIPWQATGFSRRNCTISHLNLHTACSSAPFDCCFGETFSKIWSFWMNK